MSTATLPVSATNIEHQAQHERLAHHEAADTFPMMDAERFAGHEADIAAHGLRVAITLCEGKILDGRNRYKACTGEKKVLR